MYKMIIVDDETLTLKLLSDMITKIADKFELCGTFESAEEAIRYMDNNHIDVIFSDIAMPGTSGLDFLEYVDNNFFGVHFIIISAYKDFEYVKRAFRNNAYEYILKPVNYYQIKNIIENITAELDERKEEASLENDKFMALDTDNKLIIDAKKYIRENYKKDLSLTELAEKLNISQFYFSRLFKKETGTSFVTYVSEYRCMKAKKMMDNSDESIAAISEKCGFNNAVTFNRTFKKIEGITPQQYKQNNGGVKDEK